MTHICPKCGRWIPKKYEKSHIADCSGKIRKSQQEIKKSNKPKEIVK